MPIEIHLALCRVALALKVGARSVAWAEVAAVVHRSGGLSQKEAHGFGSSPERFSVEETLQFLEIPISDSLT